MLQSISFELSKSCLGQVLPPPISHTRTTTRGLKWVKRDVDAHYFSLTQNLALKAQLGVAAPKNFPKGIPYVYSCSAAQNNGEAIVF